MAKPETKDERRPSVPPNQMSATVFRVVPAVDAKGQRIPGRWDCVELHLTGAVHAVKRHETSQVLPVAREKWHRLMADLADVREPETLR